MSIRARRLLLAESAATLLCCCAAVNAVVLDNGVDPANLGKGDWIYFLSAATNQLGGNVPGVRDLPSLMAYEKRQGMDFIIVKAGEGARLFPSSTAPQFTSNLVYHAHAAGLKVFGYTRSYGTNIPGEIAISDLVYAMGADGFVLNAEAEWESSQLGTTGPARALELCRGIKTAHPGKFLAHAPMPIISKHTSFPYKEFGYFCDAVMPQAYWKNIKVTPADMVAWMNNEWRIWQNSLSDQWKNAIKPLAPVGQGWSPMANAITTGAEITTFVNALKIDTNAATAGGYLGVSFWRADLHTADMWTAMATNSIGDPNTNPPVIFNITLSNLSNTNATISWVTDQPSDSVVDYGTTTDYRAAITNLSAVHVHVINMSGLSAGITNHFRIKSTDTAGRQSVSTNFFFTTPAIVTATQNDTSP